MKYGIAAVSVVAARDHMKWVIENSEATNTGDIVIISSSDSNSGVKLRGYGGDGLEVWICSTFYDGKHWADLKKQLRMQRVNYQRLPGAEC